MPQRSTTGGHSPDEDAAVRYAFVAGIDAYIQSIGLQSQETLKTKARKLRQFAAMFEELRAKDPTLDINPKRMGEREIFAFVQVLRSKRLDPGTQQHYLTMLGDYLAFNRNGIVGILKAAHRASWARRKDKPIHSLTLVQVNEIVEAADNIPGWTGQVARFAVLMYAVTAARPGELRLARLEDLTLSPLALTISNPKGHDIYGSKEVVKIDELYGDRIAAYLHAREDYLARHGATSEHLIPNVYPHGGAGPWSEGLWGQLKALVSSRTPYRWSWRTLRSAHAQILHNVYGVPIEDCSARLRHDNITTTQKYYAQLNKGQAQERIDARLSEAKAAGAPLIAWPAGKGSNAIRARRDSDCAQTPWSWPEIKAPDVILGEPDLSCFSFIDESAEAMA